LRVRDDRAYRRASLNWRLETVSWGLFFIMLGGLALAPGGVPEGAWLVGTGVIMLGLNGLRLVLGIRPSTVTVILGAIALISGIGSIYGINFPVWPVLIILIGLAIIVRAFSRGR
jgi:hypothetical protein